MRHSALIVIDPQIDFCPGGALAVKDGDAIMPLVNRLQARADAVALTQDWHPADHASFASSHPGAAAFSTVEASYGPQTLWPDHCVRGTRGAEFHPDLDLSRVEAIFRKGFRSEVDSYSAFFENDRKTPTGLAGWLRERDWSRVTLCGLATDYCVAWSALDASRLGFEVTVVLDACRAIDLDGSLKVATGRMRDAGVALVDSGSLF